MSWGGLAWCQWRPKGRGHRLKGRGDRKAHWAWGEGGEGPGSGSGGRVGGYLWEVGGYGLAVGESMEDSGAQMEEVRPEGP